MLKVICPRKCEKFNVAFRRNDLERHLRQVCQLRPYQCEHCGFKDTYQEITSVHSKMCTEYPVECPNVGCNAKHIKRRNLKAHQSSCLYERVECPFKEVGCDDKIYRYQYDHHMTHRTQQHLLLVMKGYLNMKEKVGSLEKQLQSGQH